MTPARDLAQELVEYDRRLAADVLAHIVTALGGEIEGDEREPEVLAAALQRVSLSTITGSTTNEWKQDLAHFERTKSLGGALVDALA